MHLCSVRPRSAIEISINDRSSLVGQKPRSTFDSISSRSFLFHLVFNSLYFLEGKKLQIKRLGLPSHADLSVTWSSSRQKARCCCGLLRRLPGWAGRTNLPPPSSSLFAVSLSPFSLRICSGRRYCGADILPCINLLSFQSRNCIGSV